VPAQFTVAAFIPERGDFLYRWEIEKD